jgi:hypothetical protein
MLPLPPAMTLHPVIPNPLESGGYLINSLTLAYHPDLSRYLHTTSSLKTPGTSCTACIGCYRSLHSLASTSQLPADSEDTQRHLPNSQRSLGMRSVLNDYSVLTHSPRIFLAQHDRAWEALDYRPLWTIRELCPSRQHASP